MPVPASTRNNNTLDMKKVLFPTLLVLVLAVACTKTVSPQEKLTANDAKINDIIAQMTLEEKVEMLHSKTNMSSAGVERLGIADIHYADGPFGIREEGQPNGFMSAGWTLDSATYFPTGSALAATWSEDLAYKYGTGMGKEARLRGKDVILGPAVNIQRLPVGGRTYEYLSEDPILSAALALYYTKGVQDEGTAVCIKHFAVNNQETNRGSVDVKIDERTLREIYLKPFERAIIEGGAMSVMPAYNKVNGDYCSENEHLLNEILRGEWGFKGMTVSDWGGTHSTMGAMLHGLNVQMTGSNYLGQPVIDSIATGALTEDLVDEKVRQILRVRFAVEAVPADVANTQMTSQPESQQIAREVAEKSIVLLKNQGILPIKAEVKKIAVIGQNAVLKTQSGGMGAGVKALYEVTPLEGIQKRAGNEIQVTYAPGYKNFPGRRWGPAPAEPNPLEAAAIDEPADPALVAEAVALAQDADLVIFFGGTNKNIETEGSDRKDIKLPCGQEALVQALYAANPNLATVLISGGPTDLQVLEPVSPAIVQGWWNGTEGGTALAEVLFGDIAPSGKLPFTFPVKLEDSPAYAMGNFPDPNGAGGDLFTLMFRPDVLAMTPAQRQAFIESLPKPVSEYTERFYVGYRWFDTKAVKPMYAFGHGLSYVTFGYENCKASVAGDKVKLSFQLVNEGEMDAEEVVQLYVHRIDSSVEWPEKELKAFQRVRLKAGERKKVSLEIPMDDLRYWNEATNAWDLEHGRLQLLLGAASDDIRQTAEVTI